MRSIPEYQWGVIVNYNMDKPVAGDGSCVFLHQWTGPASTTAGCTAMSPENIEDLIRWINGDGRSKTGPTVGREDTRVTFGLPRAVKLGHRSCRSSNRLASNQQSSHIGDYAFPRALRLE